MISLLHQLLCPEGYNMHRWTGKEEECHGGHISVTATLSSAMRRLFFEKARHQFHQITRFVGAVQLVNKDLVPPVFAGPGRTRQGK